MGDRPSQLHVDRRILSVPTLDVFQVGVSSLEQVFGGHQVSGAHVLFQLCELRGSEPSWAVRWVTHVETPEQTAVAARVS